MYIENGTAMYANLSATVSGRTVVTHLMTPIHVNTGVGLKLDWFNGSDIELYSYNVTSGVRNLIYDFSPSGNSNVQLWSGIGPGRVLFTAVSGASSRALYSAKTATNSQILLHPGLPISASVSTFWAIYNGFAIYQV